MNEEKILQMLTQILEEQKNLSTRIDGLHQEMNGLHQEMNGLHQEMNGLRQEMNARFDEVDVRFEKVDARFDKVDEEIVATHLATGDIVTQIGDMFDEKLSSFAHELQWTQKATAQNSMDIAAMKFNNQ